MFAKRAEKTAPIWGMTQTDRFHGDAEGRKFVAGNNSVPRSRPVISRSTFMEDYRRILSGKVRTNPSYADCWLIGSVGELDVLAEYDTPNGHVVVGTAADGETEYNLTPSEYTSPDAVNCIIEDAIEAVRRSFREHGGRTDRQFVTSVARDFIDASSDAIMIACGGNVNAMEEQMERMCDIVYRYSVGLGVFDILLSDPKLEDIYIDAPYEKNRIHAMCQHIGTAINPTGL